ncbi:carbonic anhydrase [Streptomyces sp. NPDC015127]|uniref:carbonic anhydrase n=1 Tax=Streptomyces sp. NPDC015127 TaxID=3364939 RepID=UPI0037001160
MQSLIDNARSFADHVAANAQEFTHLADGQAPETLFITCSDSRVVPAWITGARPGELFELRTAGNIVPPYPPQGRPAGEAATIEYALRVLSVRDIVVCGHSHCGAVGAVVRGEDLSSVPAVREWLEHTTRVEPSADETPDLARAVQRHVLAQLDTLRGYPAVQEGLRDGSLTLHGWYYEVHTGTVSVHRPGTEAVFDRL